MEGINHTPAESKLLISIMKNNKAAVSPDWAAVAKECGYGSTAAASACWSRVRKNKLSGSEAPIGGVDKKSPSKKAAGPKKVTSADEVAKKGGKGGKGGKGAKVVQAEEEDGEDEEDEEEEASNAAVVKEEEVSGDSGDDE